MKTKMNKLDPAAISIASDNIAWAVANKAAWAIIGAAKMQHADNVQQVERPKFENTMLVDGVREQLVIAANLVNGAELDGIETNILERELDMQMEGAFIIDAKQLARIDRMDYTDLAVNELVNEMGVTFIEQPDIVITDVERLELKKTLNDSDIEALLVTRKETNQKQQVEARVIRLRSDAKKQLIIACDTRKEYRDICGYFARCITNAPDAANAITGNQDVTDYIAAREQAVQTRLKSLRQNSTMIDGEWKNRYDRNGHPNADVISELNGHFTILLEEAIKVGIDVAAIEALPTQADVAALSAKLKSA